MGILARLIPGPALDERAVPRTRVEIGASLRGDENDPGLEGCAARVLDISAEGFLAECDVDLEPATTVRLELPSLASLRASVRWRDGRRHGFRFDIPLSLAQVHEISLGISWRNDRG